MLREVSMKRLILLPVKIKNMDANKRIPKSLVAIRLLQQLSFVKAIKGIGYFHAVTKLDSIDNEREIDEDNSSFLKFFVAFQCRTFLPVKGEVMVGIVRYVTNTGALLKSGPANCIYLSLSKMPNYHFLPGEKPHFLSDDLSRIEKDVVVRFMVFATRWKQKLMEITTLASLEGDGLRPLSLAGIDQVFWVFED